MITFLLVISACGGSDSGDDTAPTGVSDSAVGSNDGLTTVTIDDVVVTLEVLDGAVPAGTEIEITAGNVPAELAGIDNMMVTGFDLEPSGLVFSEPATITFRFAASGDMGTPLAAVLIGGPDGTASFLSVKVTRFGDEVEVSALVGHFSSGWLVRDVGDLLHLTPNPLKMDKGETAVFYVKAELEGAQDRENVQIDIDETTYFVLVGATLGYGLRMVMTRSGTFADVPFADVLGEITCLEETDGVVENAYEALLVRETSPEDDPSLSLIAERLARADFDWTIHLFGDVECGPATTTDPPTGSAKEAVGDQVEATTSEQVLPGEGVPGGDITDVRHELGSEGEHCFIIDVVSDGEQAAAEAGNYVIDIEVVDPDGEGGGWGAEVQFRLGTPEPGSVQIGVEGPGRDRLEGAAVTAAWDDSDTVRVCVDGGETTLGVETFTVSIGVFTPDGVFFDDAEGVGAS